METHQIFAFMKPEVAAGIFSAMQEGEKPLYKATIDSLAKQRNLRPVFIERKPKLERYEWMRQALGRKANEGVSSHLLQIWLVKMHAPMLCDFMDSLGVKHDENGTVDELPEAPTPEVIHPAVESLLAKFDPNIVTIYLHAFVALDDSGGWPSLKELLETDPRLKLAA